MPEVKELGKTGGFPLASFTRFRSPFEREFVRWETFPDNFFDVAIGNVPFGQFHVADKRYDRLNFPIHEYFVAKMLDQGPLP